MPEKLSMKDETKLWLTYAQENLKSSKILLTSHLYNPCLQNVQQTVEKALKAVFIEKGLKLKKSHDLLELNQILQQHKIEIDISEDECEFLNSIFLPSKYPIGSALPHYDPDESICQDAINIGKQTLESVRRFLNPTNS